MRPRLCRRQGDMGLSPYEMGAWHSGTGGANPANIDHIAFEMVEPGPGASSPSYDPARYEAYTRACIANAVVYCVMLCRQFGFTAADITSHYEGVQKKGIASNHSDPKHWFDKHGYSMDMFRREVDRKLKGEIEVMGKVVNADALIQWINSNAVETEEGRGAPPLPRPRRLHTRHTPMADGGRRSPAATMRHQRICRGIGQGSIRPVRQVQPWGDPAARPPDRRGPVVKLANQRGRIMRAISVKTSI